MRRSRSASQKRRGRFLRSCGFIPADACTVKSGPAATIGSNAVFLAVPTSPSFSGNVWSVWGSSSPAFVERTSEASAEERQRLLNQAAWSPDGKGGLHSSASSMSGSVAAIADSAMKRLEQRRMEEVHGERQAVGVTNRCEACRGSAAVWALGTFTEDRRPHLPRPSAVPSARLHQGCPSVGFQSDGFAAKAALRHLRP